MALEFVIYSLAAVGLICILRSVCDILLLGFLHAEECAELYLFLDGRAPGAEHLLRAAHRARRAFLPGLPVVFIDTGEGCASLRRLAGELDMEYFGM